MMKRQGEHVEILTANFSPPGYPHQSATREKPKNSVLCFQHC